MSLRVTFMKSSFSRDFTIFNTFWPGPVENEIPYMMIIIYMSYMMIVNVILSNMMIIIKKKIYGIFSTRTKLGIQ